MNKQLTILECTCQGLTAAARLVRREETAEGFLWHAKQPRLVFRCLAVAGKGYAFPELAIPLRLLFVGHIGQCDRPK